jgi:serine protease Do
MIRRTLDATKEATFSIILPGLRRKGMVPTGTGFFVSPDGWFVTAAHVITENHLSDGPVRNDISRAWLMQESRDIEEPDRMCQAVSVAFVDPSTDFALLKVDFQANHKKDWLRESTSFPFIEMSSRELEEGEPVY